MAVGDELGKGYLPRLASLGRMGKEISLLNYGICGTNVDHNFEEIQGASTKERTVRDTLLCGKGFLLLDCLQSLLFQSVEENWLDEPRTATHHATPYCTRKTIMIAIAP
jgi:hypothetical protein